MNPSRPLHTVDKRTPTVAQAQADLHRGVVEQVRATVEKDAVVVVGMATNTFVKRARQALTEANIPFTYLEYGGYLNQWKERLAIKLWSGWPTFPQVFVRGTLVGGFNETKQALDDGSLRKLLEG